MLLDPTLIPEGDVLPSDTDPHQRAELEAFWMRRADGEWTTAAALEHVFADLETLGAPASLLSLAKTSIEDERRHTRWCAAMAQRIGGAHYPPQRKGNKPLAFHGASAKENALFRCLFAGCVSETIALHVLRRSHQDITSSTLRAVNRQHMAEEVNHARLGWGFLAWLDASGALDRATRSTLESALPVLVDLSVQSWLGSAQAHSKDLVRFGAIAYEQVDVGVREALLDVILPGFSNYALHCSVPTLMGSEAPP